MTNKRYSKSGNQYHDKGKERKKILGKQLLPVSDEIQKSGERR
jgi:hypothetical protein